MRILHTSDWHLGKSLSGHLLDEDQRFGVQHKETMKKNKDKKLK